MINGTSFTPSENMVNTQLPYDINQAMMSNTWNSNFHSISLHSLMKHLVSDTKNIKESLCHITKYIFNKKIKSSKANYVNDLKDIDKTT